MHELLQKRKVYFVGKETLWHSWQWYRIIFSTIKSDADCLKIFQGTSSPKHRWLPIHLLDYDTRCFWSLMRSCYWSYCVLLKKRCLKLWVYILIYFVFHYPRPNKELLFTGARLFTSCSVPNYKCFFPCSHIVTEKLC